MTNLPSLYARVVAVRPDLAVPHLEHKPCWCGCGPRWILSRHLSSTHYPEDVDVAALILARWVEGLPEGMCLARVQMTHSGEAWIVAQDMNDDTSAFIGPNPIEALAAFYLGET